MKKIILIACALFLGINMHAQRQRDNMSRIPQTNTEPTEQEIAKREREVEERKEEFIDNFLTTLEADEFQKHIIKQNVNSFFDAKLALLRTPFDHSLDFKKAVENLENTHFKDLEGVVSEGDMTKILEMVKGDFNEKDVIKKKKRKKKKRNKD